MKFSNSAALLLILGYYELRSLNDIHYHEWVIDYVRKYVCKQCLNCLVSNSYAHCNQHLMEGLNRDKKKLPN